MAGTGVETPSAFASFARRCGANGVRGRAHEGAEPGETGEVRSSGAELGMVVVQNVRESRETSRRSNDRVGLLSPHRSQVLQGSLSKGRHHACVGCTYVALRSCGPKTTARTPCVYRRDAMPQRDADRDPRGMWAEARYKPASSLQSLTVQQLPCSNHFFPDVPFLHQARAQSSTWLSRGHHAHPA